MKALDRWEVSDQLARLDLLEAQRQELDQEIRQRGKTDRVSQALQTLQGIGPSIALRVVAEIGDLWRRIGSPAGS